MTSKLTLYNGACAYLGERKLTALANGQMEGRPARYELDTAWDRGAVKACLEAGAWKFATRSMSYTAAPSITPEPGFTYAFDKPTDWVRTMAVCTDAYFTQPLLAYTDEAGYWFADLDTLYVRYVSNANDYGGDMSLWPQSFIKYVGLYLAAEVVMPLTGSRAKLEDIEVLKKAALLDALSKDAMAGPSVIPPAGSWVRARSGGYTYNGGRWNGFS